MLSGDRTRLWLVQTIDEARQKAEFDLGAYVLIPEHVHVLLYPRNTDYDISSILWRIKRPVGRKAIAFLRTERPGWLGKLSGRQADGTLVRQFWQAGGGHDRNIIEPKTALKVIEYLHLNPVRRGLVERPEDWKWSSARWYAGLRPVPLEMDATLPRTFRA